MARLQNLCSRSSIATRPARTRRLVCCAEVEQEMAAALEKKMLEVRKWEEATRKEMQQQIASQQQEQLKILEVPSSNLAPCLHACFRPPSPDLAEPVGLSL
jgi:Na+-transporting NADH:ubiquinone oxidoreductase subunit NqrF